MFVEKVKSEGLAHLSWVIGSGGEAAVIDPRRDVEAYVKIAASRGCRITHVFETHRNEDILSGAAQLARLCGAPVHHGPNPADDVRYADTVREGDAFMLGSVRMRVLETPGHTDDSISLVYADTAFGDDAVGVFTGDALFVGDVGRTDFYPERARDVAGLLFDSLRKLLALGDQAVIHPAHGAGSVCGAGMADRELSTIGYERRHNAALRIEVREQFIEHKLAEHHLLPPYFSDMERLNLTGAADLPPVLTPAPLSAATTRDLTEEAGVIAVDVRPVTAFLGAHLPGSLALPLPLLASYAGWLLERGQQLVLVADGADAATEAARRLARIGHDQVHGFLAPSLVAWTARGLAFGAVPVVDAEEVARRIAADADDWTLLDVRTEPEVRERRIEPSRHVHVGDVPAMLDQLDAQRHYTVMCGSGARATVAASVLLRAGFARVDVFLGSMGAWQAREAAEGAG